MNKMLVTALCAAMVGGGGSALAAQITYMDAAEDVLLNKKGDNSIVLTFDLGSSGWVQGQPLVLSFDVADDGRDGKEFGSFTYEGQLAPIYRTKKEEKKAKKEAKKNSNINSDYWKQDFIVNDSAITDGKFEVTLTALKGDFYFRSATLEWESTSIGEVNASTDSGVGFSLLQASYPGGAQDENPGAPVPEPTTMLLFGTGLLGLAAFGRRREGK